MGIKKDTCANLSDQEIIQKSLADIDYFACLYDRYEQRLLRYIHKVSLANHQEAEDILQDAFIKIWRHLHDVDQELKLSSWLYRIVHNETISFCRKKRSFGKNRQVSIEDSNLETVPDDIHAEDPEEKYMITHEFLNKLPVKYREVLILKFLERMSYEEISDVLKIPEGTVAVRINRAKSLFRKIAEKENIEFTR